MSSKARVSINASKRSKLNDRSAKNRSNKVSKVAAKVKSESEAESEHDDASTSESDGAELEDELDLDEVSSEEIELGGSDEEEEKEEEKGKKVDDEDDFPRKKKSSKSKHDDGSGTFSAALTNILSSHLKAYDRKDPIMARNKKVIRQNDADKLEQKAKKAIVAEKKKLLDKSRKKDIIPLASAAADSEEIRQILEKERKLRKIAQKGVVKLFNAILSTQVKTEKEVNDSLTGVKNISERKELITEVSKEKFFDLVKAAGDS